MQTKAETVIQWMNQNLPPLSWRVIAVKNMKMFIDHNISTLDITPTTYFNAEIIGALKVQIKQDYNKDLPIFN